MPGVYTEYDFDEANKKPTMGSKLGKNKSSKKQNLNEIKEVPEDEDGQEKLEDNIWELDGDGGDDYDDGRNSVNSMGGDYDNPELDQDQVADSLVMGVSEYNEFRLGSVRFEKEMQTKKQQVLKDLLKFCIIRCFRPDRIVREV